MFRCRDKSTHTLKRMSTDKRGVVSFEYVLLAACVLGSVTAALGTSTGGPVMTALTSMINAIGVVIGAAVGS